MLPQILLGLGITKAVWNALTKTEKASKLRKASKLKKSGSADEMKKAIEKSKKAIDESKAMSKKHESTYNVIGDKIKADKAAKNTEDTKNLYGIGKGKKVKEVDKHGTDTNVGNRASQGKQTALESDVYKAKKTINTADTRARLKAERASRQKKEINYLTDKEKLKAKGKAEAYQAKKGEPKDLDITARVRETGSDGRATKLKGIVEKGEFALKDVKLKGEKRKEIQAAVDSARYRLEGISSQPVSKLQRNQALPKKDDLIDLVGMAKKNK